MFQVGQRVVCVDDSGHSLGLVAGGKYHVSHVFQDGNDPLRIRVAEIFGISFCAERFRADDDEEQQGAEKVPEVDYKRPVWIIRGPGVLVEQTSRLAALSLASDYAKMNPGQFFQVLSPDMGYVHSTKQVDMGVYDSATEYDVEQI